MILKRTMDGLFIWGSEAHIFLENIPLLYKRAHMINIIFCSFVGLAEHSAILCMFFAFK